MSFWFLVKTIAAICVIAIMLFTGMLAYHVGVAPIGGVFSRLIPDPGSIIRGPSDVDFATMLESAEMPDIDPGEKSFQKAHELLALGKLSEAREKLTTIVNIYPTSSSAPLARRIVGEINLDEILSTSHMEGKQVHTVKRGDSYLGIAAKYHTTIDCIMHLNSMMELRGIQPGDEIIVMPLEFRLLIEPRRKSLSLWDGGRFIREYPILHSGNVPPSTKPTVISSQTAELEGKRVPPQAKAFRGADKVITLKTPPLQIRAWDGNGESPPSGILLRPQDMEEITLLTRPGNKVEIR